MPFDLTETYRRQRLAKLNLGRDKAALELLYGKVWTPAELAVEFEVLAFSAPYVVVRRRIDGRKGSLEFQHEPRFYFNWQGDE